MVKYYFIAISYKLEEEKPVLYLWGRDVVTLQKRMFRILGFESHFFVHDSEPVPTSSAIVRVESGFKSIFGEPCKKIVTNSPHEVKELRKFFKKTYQADVPFVRVFLIYMNIKTVFEAPEKDELHYTEIRGE